MGFLQDLLAVTRVLEEVVCEEVADSLRRSELCELMVEVVRYREACCTQLGAEVEELGVEFLNFILVGWLGKKGAEFGDTERGLLGEAGERDACEALKDEVGGAVVHGDAGSDDAEARGVEEVVGGAGFVEAGLDLGDAEESVTFQSVAQHLAVARFEDAQWHECVGQQGGALQWHYRCLLEGVQGVMEEFFQAVPTPS